jgi:hypothetical protein
MGSLPGQDGGRGIWPACSCRRRGFGRGETGPTRPIGRGAHVGGWWAQRKAAEQGRRQGMAAAVAARPCARQGAGEYGGMERAQAPWSRGDAILVPGSAGGGAEGGRRRGGGSGFTGGNGGMMFWWLGCQRAVKKLLGSFYAMMWCCWCPWLGLRGFVAASRWRGRAAAKLELTGAAGDDARVREIGIGWVSGLQGVVAVLLERWIVGERRHGRLTTAARGCGGAPARSCARGKEMLWNRSA